MIIINTILKSKWEIIKDREYFGEELLARDGFIHFASIGQYEQVAKKFKDIAEDILLLLFDENKIEAGVTWEDLKGKGIDYPHVYGLLNTSAIVKVLPFLRDENGNWIPNEELQLIIDER